MNKLLDELGAGFATDFEVDFFRELTNYYNWLSYIYMLYVYMKSVPYCLTRILQSVNQLSQ